VAGTRVKPASDSNYRSPSYLWMRAWRRRRRPEVLPAPMEFAAANRSLKFRSKR